MKKYILIFILVFMSIKMVYSIQRPNKVEDKSQDINNEYYDQEITKLKAKINKVEKEGVNTQTIINKVTGRAIDIEKDTHGDDNELNVQDSLNYLEDNKVNNFGDNMSDWLNFTSTAIIKGLDSDNKQWSMDLLSKSTYQAIIELHTSSSTNWDTTALASTETVITASEMSDNFNDNSINSDLWNQDLSNSSLSETGNKIVISPVVSTSYSYANMISSYIISGDFDIQVDCSLITYTDDTWTGLQVYNLLTGSDYKTLFLYFQTPNGGITQQIDSQYRNGDTYDTDTTGGVGTYSTKLRITRINNILNSFYWNGSSWVDAEPDSHTISEDIRISLYSSNYTDDGTYENYQTNLDNFIVNNATRIYKVEDTYTGSVGSSTVNYTIRYLAEDVQSTGGIDIDGHTIKASSIQFTGDGTILYSTSTYDYSSNFTNILNATTTLNTNLNNEITRSTNRDILVGVDTATIRTDFQNSTGTIMTNFNNYGLLSGTQTWTGTNTFSQVIQSTVTFSQNSGNFNSMNYLQLLDKFCDDVVTVNDNVATFEGRLLYWESPH